MKVNKKTANDSLNNISLFNQKDKEYMEMDIEKLREIITILKEHQDKSVKAGKFVEAEMARQRIAQFKKIEKDKQMQDLKQNLKEDNEMLQEEQAMAIDVFNKEYDERFASLVNKWESAEKEMEEKHLSVLENDIAKWDDAYPKIIKYSTKLLNEKKILDELIKKEEFIKAHDLQVVILDMTKREDREWQEKKEKAKIKEIERIRRLQINEQNAHILKKNSVYNEFKKKRAIELNNLLQKFKNRRNDTQHEQKNYIMMQSTLNRTKSLMSVPGTTRNAKSKFDKFCGATEKRERKTRVNGETGSDFGSHNNENNGQAQNNGEVKVEKPKEEKPVKKASEDDENDNNEDEDESKEKGKGKDKDEDEDEEGGDKEDEDEDQGDEEEDDG